MAQILLPAVPPCGHQRSECRCITQALLLLQLTQVCTQVDQRQ